MRKCDFAVAGCVVRVFEMPNLGFGNRLRLRHLATLITYVCVLGVCSVSGFFRKTDVQTEDYVRKKGLLYGDCPLSRDQHLLSVLPGVGWDNLVNEERGLTTNREVYSHCRVSSDGKLLLPDDIVVEPIRSSRIELSSEVFSHFTNYTSLTAYSMNTATDVRSTFVSISGDFSFEKESVRQAENTNNGLIVRSQLRHRIYAVHQLPDSVIHPRLRNRLLDIAAHIEMSNLSFVHLISMNSSSFNPASQETDEGQLTNMVDTMRAAYLADLIIRDFGTHTVTSVEAGALVAKIDSLSSASRTLNDADKFALRTSASASFTGFFKMSVKTSATNNDEASDEYKSMVSSSTIVSHGGTHLKTGDVNITQWEEGVESNLVAIDRRGRPIYDLISPRALPELSETMAFRLAGVIKAAVERYYMANSIVGCLDPKSPSFDTDANVAADDCDSNKSDNDDFVTENKRMPFGGVYETCYGVADLCKGREFANPATGKATCPSGYMSVQLIPPQVRACASKCEQNSYFRSPECKQMCATTTAYWCAIDPQTINSSDHYDLGFLFGGLYTDTMVNPTTNSQSCPMYFEALSIGRRLRVCVSTDREFGKTHAMSFGGFYACQSGNPLIDVLSNEDKQLNDRGTQKYHITRPSLLGSRVQKRIATVSPGLIADMNALFQTTWPKRCPIGYSSHLAAIEEICQVNYCLPANSLKSAKERKLKRPPFIQLPELGGLRADVTVSQRLDKQVILHSVSGRSYANIDGNWQIYNPKIFAISSENIPAHAWWLLAGLLCLMIFAGVATFVGVRHIRESRCEMRRRHVVASAMSTA